MSDTSHELWAAVDHYLTKMMVGHDDALDEAVRASDAAGLPSIQVSPLEGKMLHIIAKAIGATRILEIGTLGGYSTIWLARALAGGGRLITMEIDPEHARVARSNLERADVSDRVEIRIGDARELLPDLARESSEPFDLVFIDADKPSIPEYYEWALKMSRKGALVIVDNVVRKGAVVDATSDDASVQGVRRLNAIMTDDPRVDATVIQTVGVKGYDGLAIALVK